MESLPSTVEMAACRSSSVYLGMVDGKSRMQGARKSRNSRKLWCCRRTAKVVVWWGWVSVGRSQLIEWPGDQKRGG